VTLTIELERENDGHWLAEVPALPGVMCYGCDRDEAVARVQALALRVLAEKLERREAPAEFLTVIPGSVSTWPAAKARHGPSLSSCVSAGASSDNPDLTARLNVQTGLTSCS
jgi:predicted RNase H-like HicB family nuclease